MFDIFKNRIPDPVNSETLKEILNKHISPVLSKIGLEWDGNNQWISPSENTTRKIFKHQVGKGLMGTFIWGISYDFLPIISGGKIILQRTFKSAKPHLFENSITTNAFGNTKSDLQNGITTTWGEKECNKSVSELILKKEQEIFDWFNNASTFQGSLDIANRQMTNNNYNTHWPNPKYVAAFLKAKIGDKENGLALLEQVQNERLNIEQELFEKIEKRLNEL